MKNKLLFVLLIAIIIVSIIPILVSAVNTDSSASLTVETPWTNPGSEVNVNIVVSENPGILGATIVVSWDECLTLLADASGEAFSHMTYTSPSRYTSSGTNFVWFGNEVNEAIDGTALTLTFQVPETAENNEILPIYVTYTYGDVIDKNDHDVTLSITDGHVRVITYKPGDVTNDNRVNSRDLVRLSQYVSDGCTTDPDGYNAEVVADACDVNGDGRVNARDLIRLSQYISDGSQTSLDGYNAVLNPAKMPTCEHSNMVKANYQASSCTETGMIEHWYCSDCAKYFADAEGTTEIAYADTIIATIEHTEVEDLAVLPTVDKTGLTAGKHCSVCESVIVKQEIIPIDNRTITYKNALVFDKKFVLPTIASEYCQYSIYSENDLVLPIPTVNGYKFDGWYTVSEGGNLIEKISAGDTKNYTLYARWELVEYDIVYDKGGASEDNPKKYTIESATIVLEDPKLPGYNFDYWTDENGNVITEIPKGSTGDIRLTPHWISLRNWAIPASELPNPEFSDTKLFDEENGQYTFIYYLGEIQNVPLDTVFTGTYSGVGSFTQSIKNSVQIDETQAKSITTAVENTTSNTQSWSYVENWSSTETRGREVSHNVGFSIGKENVFNISGGASTTTQWSKSTTNGWSNATDESETQSHTNSKGYSTELIYSQSATHEVSCDFTIPDGAPSGSYRVATTGTAHVFGVVTYNAKTDSYNVWTFSILGECNDGLLIDYSALTNNFDDCTGELPFIIPDEVDDFANSIVDYTDGLKFTPYMDGQVQKCTVSKYTGIATDIVIPAYYNGMMVTGMSPSVFAGNTAITSVKLGKYMTSIPDGSFEGCTSLQAIEMPAIETIGANAFKDCARLDCELPETVTSIGNNVFEGCVNLKTISFGNQVTFVGTNVFKNCGQVLEVYVNASNKMVLQNSISSGASNVSICLSDYSDSLNDTTLIIANSLNYFELDGANKSVTNLNIISYANETVLKNIIIQDNRSDSVLRFSSSNVTLHHVQVTTHDVALTLLADKTNLLIGGSVKLKTTANEIAFMSKSVYIDSDDDELMGELRIEDIYYVNGEIRKSDMVIVYPGDPETEAKITFDANGGTASFTEQIYKLWNPLGTLPTASRTGYQFDGWYAVNQKITSTTIMDDTLHAVEAKWTAITYYVEYVANKPENASHDVEGSMANLSCTYDKKFALKNNEYSLIGWAFQGWATSADGEVVYGDGAEISQNLTSVASDTIKLYAVWKANTYTVTYDANGGTGTTVTSTFTYDSSNTFSANGFTNTDTVTWYANFDAKGTIKWEFMGWSTNQAATQATYKNEQATQDNLATGGNVTLYAVWNNYSITSNGAVFVTDDGGWGLYGKALFPPLNSEPINGWLIPMSKKSNFSNRINLSSFNSCMNSNYTFVFTVTVEMAEVSDGYQEICLFNRDDIHDDTTGYSRVVAESKGLVAWVEVEHTNGDLNEKQSEHTVTIEVSGDKVKPEMFLRYDANGNDEDTWLWYGAKVSINIIPN